MILREGRTPDGFDLRLTDDTESTGGYLLLFSKDFADPAAEGFDEWYPTLADAERAFAAFGADVSQK